MPRKISVFPTFALRPRISNMPIPFETLCRSNSLLQRRLNQSPFESLSIGNRRDRNAGEEFGKHDLRLFPNRFLRAYRAEGTIIGALIEIASAPLAKVKPPLEPMCDWTNPPATKSFMIFDR